MFCPGKVVAPQAQYREAQQDALQSSQAPLGGERRCCPAVGDMERRLGPRHVLAAVSAAAHKRLAAKRPRRHQRIKSFLRRAADAETPLD
jgi:hypothetical protein